MNYVKNQLKTMRSQLLNEIEGLTPEVMDIQPKGFNNTIHWHLGHVLNAAEMFLLGANQALPEHYGNLFGYGTKPADWTGDVPSVETLKQQLKEQLDRLLALPEDLDQKMEKPFKGIETLGEFINFVVLHETNHIGQIHAMKKVIGAQS